MADLTALIGCSILPFQCDRISTYNYSMSKISTLSDEHMVLAPKDAVLNV